MRQRGMILMYAVIALGIIGALGFIGRQIYNAGGDSVRLEWEKANDEQRKAEAKKASEASGSLEAKNSRQRVVYRTITKSVDRYIDRPVYRNICIDDDGLRDVNAALLGALTPAIEPDKRVSDADKTR